MAYFVVNRGSRASPPRVTSAKVMFRRLGRWLFYLVLVGVCYLSLAFGQHLLFARPSKGPLDGIKIYVTTNGYHTSLILPMIGAGHDWAPILPESAKIAPAGADYVSFGWGARDFYLHTPRVEDLDWVPALKAVLGLDQSLLHVSWVHDPKRWSRQYAELYLSEAQYRILTAALENEFIVEEKSRPITGFHVSDLFYPAHGRYSAFFTCNTWTNHKLAQAGVAVWPWTPFSENVMAQFGG